MDSESSEEFYDELRMHHGSVLSSFLFAVWADAIELEREDMLCELLYAGDLVLRIETIVRLRKKLCE